jgi:hypothetical protein
VFCLQNMRLLEFCYSTGVDLTTSSILLSSVQMMGGGFGGGALVPQLVLLRQVGF